MSITVEGQNGMLGDPRGVVRTYIGMFMYVYVCVSACVCMDVCVIKFTFTYQLSQSLYLTFVRMCA